MNTGVLFVFIATICWGIGDFLSQKTVRRIGDYESLIWINLIAGVLLFPLIIGDFHMLLSWRNLVPLVVATVIDFAYGVLLFKAYEQGKLSVIEVVLIAELPLTIILGMAFFHESVSYVQYFLIVVILAGVYLISKNKNSIFDKLICWVTGKSKKLEKGVYIALIAATVSGLYNYSVALNTRNTSAPLTIWFMWIVGSIPLVFMIYKKTGFRQFIKKSKESAMLILVTGTIQTVAWLSFAYALNVSSLSISSAISECYPAIAIFLAVKYNKEKISRLQFLAALMTILAAVILGTTS